MAWDAWDLTQVGHVQGPASIAVAPAPLFFSFYLETKRRREGGYMYGGEDKISHNFMRKD